MAINYPASLDTDASLGKAVNNCADSLASAYTAGGTTLTLTSAALFPTTGGIVFVASERTKYTGVTGNQLTGVTALAGNYPSGTSVQLVVDAEHHNNLKDAIIALQSRVGVTGDTTAGTHAKRLSDLEAQKVTSLTGADDAHVPSALAVKTAIDSAVVGLLDDRGNYNASGNTFPTTGGSGTAGAVLKGDCWTISVAGTLGGTSVAVGDTIRALADAPGQTAANWALMEAAGVYAGTGANTFTGDQTLGGNRIINAKLKQTTEERAAPTISAGTLTLDLSTANVFDVSLNANITTLTISNVAASGTAHGFTLTFTADGTARSVSWPASFRWDSNTAPTLTSTNGKKDVITAFTTDGGTTWLPFINGQNK